jgi:hypothetical protein
MDDNINMESAIAGSTHGQYNSRVNEWQHNHGQYNIRVNECS